MGVQTTLYVLVGHALAGTQSCERRAFDHLILSISMAQRLSFSFLMACRFGILLLITATLLQLFFSVSAAEYHQSSAAGDPGTTHIDYYLRGKMNGAATEEGRQAEWQHDLLLQAGRQLTEESSSSEAESVEVADYTPCANFRHDPSVCSPP